MAPSGKLATPASPSVSENAVKKPSATSTSTVYNLTNHFSRLHPNPKPTSQSHAPKYMDSPLQVKALSKSATHVDSSSSYLPLYIRKPGKRVVFENDKNKSLVVDGKDAESKKPLKKEERDLKSTKKGGDLNQGKGKGKGMGMGMGMGMDMGRVVKAGVCVGGDGIGKRRSFSDAKVELGNFMVTNWAKVVSADMPPFMQIHAVGFARKMKDSLEKFSSKSLALSLKKELDGVYGPAWHCIVGKSFGSFVTHSVGGFLYFSLDQNLYVLLFKTAVQRAH